MNAAEVLRYLTGRGFRVGLSSDGKRVRIEPSPSDQALVSRIRAVKLDILSYLQELGAPAATMHAFVCTSAADPNVVAEYGVCIACGIPWCDHGEPPISTWDRVEDPNSVALVQAAAIVLFASAGTKSVNS